MNRSVPSSQPPEIDLSWRMRDREARTLAQLIRGSRLTLLHAEPGLGRSELLTAGVLPLLRRRATDAVGEEDRESRVVIPFSDRRTRRGGRPSTRVAERAVLFDGWGAAPTAALQTAVLASLPADAATYVRSARLAPMLGELSRRFDAQFLIILDGFERFWDPSLTLEEAENFVDQFSEAVNLRGLRAHFLLSSLDDPADPRLEALRQRIDGFDESALHLLRWESEVVSASAPDAPRATTAASQVAPEGRVPVLDAVVLPPPKPSSATPQPAAPPAPASKAPPAAVGKPKVRRQKLPRLPVARPEPIRTEGVYAFIESTLTQTASDFAPWHDSEAFAPPAAPAPARPHEGAASAPRSTHPGPPAAAARPTLGVPRGRPLAPEAKPAVQAPARPSGEARQWLEPVLSWARQLLRKR